MNIISSDILKITIISHLITYNVTVAVPILLALFLLYK